MSGERQILSLDEAAEEAKAARVQKWVNRPVDTWPRKVLEQAVMIQGQQLQQLVAQVTAMQPHVEALNTVSPVVFGFAQLVQQQFAAWVGLAESEGVRPPSEYSAREAIQHAHDALHAAEAKAQELGQDMTNERLAEVRREVQSGFVQAGMWIVQALYQVLAVKDPAQDSTEAADA